MLWVNLIVKLSIIRDNLDVLKLILDHAKSALEISISFSIKKGRLRIVKYLFENLNAGETIGFPSYYYQARHLEIVKYFAEERNVSFRAWNDQYLRDLCGDKKYYEIVKYLCEKHYANIWSVEENYHCNAIDAFFYERFVDIDYTSEDTRRLGKYLLYECHGWYRCPRESLIFATRSYDLEFLEYLLNQHHFKNKHNGDKISALLAACNLGYLKAIEILLQEKYDINVEHNNHLALNIVFLYDRLSIFKYFIASKVYNIWQAKWIISDSHVTKYFYASPSQIEKYINTSIVDELIKMFGNKDICQHIYQYL